MNELTTTGSACTHCFCGAMSTSGQMVCCRCGSTRPRQGTRGIEMIEGCKHGPTYAIPQPCADCEGERLEEAERLRVVAEQLTALEAKAKATEGAIFSPATNLSVDDMKVAHARAEVSSPATLSCSACGKCFNHYYEVYRCADCEMPFHRDCLRNVHFREQVAPSERRELDRAKHNLTVSQEELRVAQDELVELDKAARELLTEAQRQIAELNAEVSSPATPKNRYGCKQCQRDFNHEPFTVSIGGIPAQTYFFCTTICRERWNMGYTGEPPQMPKPEQVIRVAGNVRAASPATPGLEQLLEKLPTFGVKVYRNMQDACGCMIVTVELSAVRAALASLHQKDK